MRQPQVGKLCATPFGIDIVGITEFIALVGALVGGITARQRKAELERLNEQLRKVGARAWHGRGRLWVWVCLGGGGVCWEQGAATLDGI